MEEFGLWNIARLANVPTKINIRASLVGPGAGERLVTWWYGRRAFSDGRPTDPPRAKGGPRGCAFGVGGPGIVRRSVHFYTVLGKDKVWVRAAVGLPLAPVL